MAFPDDQKPTAQPDDLDEELGREETPPACAIDDPDCESCQ